MCGSKFLVLFTFFFFSPSTNVTGAAVRPVNPQPRWMRLVVCAEAFQMRQMALTTLSSLTGILLCGWSFNQRTQQGPRATVHMSDKSASLNHFTIIS